MVSLERKVQRIVPMWMAQVLRICQDSVAIPGLRLRWKVFPGLKVRKLRQVWAAWVLTFGQNSASSSGPLLARKMPESRRVAKVQEFHRNYSTNSGRPEVQMVLRVVAVKVLQFHPDH